MIDVADVANEACGGVSAVWSGSVGAAAGMGAGCDAPTGPPRPVNARPQAWQLDCPLKTSFAPQNWHVGISAPCPSITLDL